MTRTVADRLTGNAFGLSCGALVLAIMTGACATGGAHGEVRSLAQGQREMTTDQQVVQVVNRLTFGARPGEYARVRRIGVNRWVGEQLDPDAIMDDSAQHFLARYSSLLQPDTALARIYGLPGDLRKQGGTMPDTAALHVANKSSNQTIADLREAKIARAVLSERQLREVMTDFWENHFSIFADKGADRYMLLSYDDSVRAHSLGKFRALLGVVAHSPAMLYYLDNWTSRADSDRVTLAEIDAYRKRAVSEATYERTKSRIFVDRAGRVSAGDPNAKAPAPYHPAIRHGKGLNENYGRELMELHTLGVDGGYTQEDVIEAARILTGWTIRDPNHIGAFYFNPGMHDAGQKRFMGEEFPAGHGEDEGERLLDLLARQPATAHFIALKLCRRFVSDSPSTDIVDRAAATFMRTDGDIAQVMRTIIGSPEFFAHSAYREKVKSPFEVVTSAIRALNGTPDSLQRDVQAVARLGEPLWGHLDPEGYPETGDQWLNAGSILNRINFGMQVVLGQIPGVSIGSWPPATSLASAPVSVLTDSVISNIFGGDVSPQTRDALNDPTGAQLSTAAARPKTRAAERLAQMLGVAFGTPEFQRR